MIMMRSNPTQKLGGKPPPPVPPRPSKSLVQQALAKTRRVCLGVPNRQAPAPPQGNQEVSKSKSMVSVILRKPTFNRTISEEAKPNGRPIVYMSSNAKPKTSEIRVQKEDISAPIQDIKVVSASVKDVRAAKDVRHVTDNPPDVTKKIAPPIPTTIPSKPSSSVTSSPSSSNTNSLDKNYDKMLDDRNHVNTLIDEMFASVLEVSGCDDSEEIKSEIIVNNEKTQINVEASPKTVIVINNPSQADLKQPDIIKDISNHELLISELQNMKKDQERIMRRQRKPSMNIFDRKHKSTEHLNNSEQKINCESWVGLGDKGQKVNLSSCQITLSDNQLTEKDMQDLTLDCERISKMSHLHGLPPLPKSLSGFNILEHAAQHQHGADELRKPPTPVRSSSIRSGQAGQHAAHQQQQASAQQQRQQGPHESTGATRKMSNMDSKLAILRREMYSLRQLDLSLLTQLWSLNESIQDFRQMLEDDDYTDDDDSDFLASSPTPTSEEDTEEFFVPQPSTSRGLRPAPPPPPIRRPNATASTSRSFKK